MSKLEFPSGGLGEHSFGLYQGGELGNRAELWTGGNIVRHAVFNQENQVWAFLSGNNA